MDPPVRTVVTCRESRLTLDPSLLTRLIALLIVLGRAESALTVVVTLLMAPASVRTLVPALP